MFFEWIICQKNMPLMHPSPSIRSFKAMSTSKRGSHGAGWQQFPSGSVRCESKRLSDVSTNVMCVQYRFVVGGYILVTRLRLVQFKKKFHTYCSYFFSDLNFCFATVFLLELTLCCKLTFIHRLNSGPFSSNRHVS